MKLLLALCLCLIPFCSFAKETALGTAYFGVNSDYAMPLVEIKRPANVPELESGILKDLGEALFKELGLKPIWYLLPKKESRPAWSLATSLSFAI